MAVQSVERTLSILEILATEPKGISIKDLTTRLDLPKSTIHRLLSTLVDKGYATQDEETEQYLLSMKLVSLSSFFLDRLDIRRIAKDPLEELTKSLNEVTHLSIREGDRVIYIDKVESEQTIRMYSQIGKGAMMHCTGVGKVILADLNISTIEKIIERQGLPKFTDNTITTKIELLEHLQVIREQGYALDDVEHEAGIRCIAAPIYDYTKNVIAAISISGPTVRITKERIERELKDKILHTANTISQKLGY